jgi:hypothetical protein
VDILDPHDPSRDDAVWKAVGLAQFARQHGDFFGRIEMIIVGKDNQIKRLNVNNESICDKVLPVRDASHLQTLYDEHG